MACALAAFDATDDICMLLGMLSIGWLVGRFIVIVWLLFKWLMGWEFSCGIALVAPSAPPAGLAVSRIGVI